MPFRIILPELPTDSETCSTKIPTEDALVELPKDRPVTFIDQFWTFNGPIPIPTPKAESPVPLIPFTVMFPLLT